MDQFFLNFSLIDSFSAAWLSLFYAYWSYISTSYAYFTDTFLLDVPFS